MSRYHLFLDSPGMHPHARAFWCNEKLNRRHVTEGGGKTFHGCRHTFPIRMKNLEVEPLVQVELMGHAPPGETFGRHADGYTPDMLAEATQKLT